MNAIQIEKQCLKQLVLQIRSAKSKLKESMRKLSYAPYDHHVELRTLQHEYRHRHIAYCLVRGRTYEQIEAKVAKGHEPDVALFESLRLHLQVCLLQGKGINEGPEMDALMEEIDQVNNRMTPFTRAITWKLSGEHQKLEAQT